MENNLTIVAIYLKLTSLNMRLAMLNAESAIDNGSRADKAPFKEEDHPRAKDGKFGSGGANASQAEKVKPKTSTARKIAKIKYFDPNNATKVSQQDSENVEKLIKTYKETKNSEIAEKAKKEYFNYCRNKLSSVPKSQYQAATSYCGKGYGDINSYLNHKNLKPDKELKEKINELSTLIDNSYLPCDMRVYRGVSPEGFNAMFPNKSFEELEGISFKNKGFVSTSLNPQVAQENFGRDGCVFVMSLKKGTNGLTIPSHEEEIILQKGSIFTIKKAHNLLNSNTLYLEIEYVGHEV